MQENEKNLYGTDAEDSVIKFLPEFWKFYSSQLLF